MPASTRCRPTPRLPEPAAGGAGAGTGGDAPRRTLLRVGPASHTYRVEVRGRLLYEKRYRVLWPWQWLRSALKLNVPCLSALEEARHARALSRVGVRVPAVLATWSRWRLCACGLLHESAVALAPLAGRRLDEVLADAGASGRGVAADAGRRRRRRLAVALGRMVRRMHRSGRYHRDLYLCHIYWDGPAGSMGVLDLARAAPRRLRRRRWQVKDLAALARSADGSVTAGDRVAFLRAYLDAPTLPPSVRDLARRVMRRARREAGRAARRAGAFAGVGGMG